MWLATAALEGGSVTDVAFGQADIDEAIARRIFEQVVVMFTYEMLASAHRYDPGFLESVHTLYYDVTRHRIVLLGHRDYAKHLHKEQLEEGGFPQASYRDLCKGREYSNPWVASHTVSEK